MHRTTISREQTSLIICVFIFALVFNNKPVTMSSAEEPADSNLTEAISGQHFGTTEKWDYNSSTNSTWQTCDKTSECPSALKACVPLCCSPGFVRRSGRCAFGGNDDDDVSRTIPFTSEDGVTEEFVMENYGFFVSDPCDIDGMWSSLEKDFSVFKNGSVNTPNYWRESVSDFRYFCLTWDSESRKYSVKVCRPWLVRGDLEIICTIFASVIWIVIFGVYSITPELRNLHGLIFRCYIVSDITVYICVLVIEFTIESMKTHANLFGFLDWFARICSCSSLLWSNVMNFNMWRSFRDIKSIDHNLKKPEKKTFAWYAIYAWGTSFALLTVVFAANRNVNYLREDTVGQNLLKWISVGAFVVILPCNTILQILTAININRHRMNTNHLGEASSKHYQAEKQRFGLHFKLFVIVGAHMISWPIYLSWPVVEMSRLLGVMEVVQAVAIFYVFIWKDNIKRSLWQILSESCLNRLLHFQSRT